MTTTRPFLETTGTGDRANVKPKWQPRRERPVKFWVAPPEPTQGGVRMAPEGSVSEAEDTGVIFSRLAAQWRADTATVASFPKRFMHGAYQDIVGLGPAVIGVLLRELEREPDFWFHALRHITRQNPVKPEDRGNLDAMTEAWTAWGKREGYL
jgi:hypothetical protein